MHTSNIHEITKKAAVSIAVKIITGHLLCTIWYNISNIENGGLEKVGITKRATCSSNGFTSANSMPRKKEPPPTLCRWGSFHFRGDPYAHPTD